MSDFFFFSHFSASKNIFKVWCLEYVLHSFITMTVEIFMKKKGLMVHFSLNLINIHDKVGYIK